MNSYESFGDSQADAQTYGTEQGPILDDGERAASPEPESQQSPLTGATASGGGDNIFPLENSAFSETSQSDSGKNVVREEYQGRAQKVLENSDGTENQSLAHEQFASNEEGGILFEAFDSYFYDDDFADKVRVPFAQDPNRNSSLVERSPAEKEIIIGAAKEVIKGIDEDNSSYKDRLEAKQKLYMLENLFRGESLELQMDYAMKRLANQGRYAFDTAEALAGEKGGVIGIDGPVITITFGQELKHLLKRLRRNSRRLATKEFGQD